MNTKLYVDNLAAITTYTELMELFSAHGNVVDINLPADPANGRPHGSGLVTMATPEGARAAMKALHGQEIGNQTITVSEAWPQKERGGATNGSPRRSASQLY